jgi:hypothetical protein
MPKSCIVCKAVASPDIQLQYCAQCHSAVYCSHACKKMDWRNQHRQICKFLNVGHGDMQVRTNEHTSVYIALKEQFEGGERSLTEHQKEFFKLFQESTFEGSQAAVRKMKKIAKRQTKNNKKGLLFQSIHFLIRSDLKMLSWPNSPLLVMLQFVDPNLQSGNEEEARLTLLHQLAYMAAPSDYSTHKNQLILAKQLIEHGANVNAVSIPHGRTPLHDSCFSSVVTNLDFVEYLLEAGANPNAQDHSGETPLMCTIPDAPGAAKLLLKWPATDVNISARSGESFMNDVRKTVEYYSDKVALPDNPDQIQHQLLLQQWREIEAILVERGGY